MIKIPSFTLSVVETPIVNIKTEHKAHSHTSVKATTGASVTDVSDTDKAD